MSNNNNWYIDLDGAVAFGVFTFVKRKSYNKDQLM